MCVHIRVLYVIRVAYNREALSPHCVVELLKYTNSKVLLDIRGHHFNHITRKHCDAFRRINVLKIINTCYVNSTIS